MANANNKQELATATEVADALLASDAYKSLAAMSDGNGLASSDRAAGWKEWNFCAATLAYKVAVYRYAIATGDKAKAKAAKAIDDDDKARVDALGDTFPPTVNVGSIFERKANTTATRAANPCGSSPYVSSVGNEHKGCTTKGVARGKVKAAMEALERHPDLFAAPLPGSGLPFAYIGRGKANGGRALLAHPGDAREALIRCCRAALRVDANAPTGPATIDALHLLGTAMHANADALLVAAERYRTCTVSL